MILKEKKGNLRVRYLTQVSDEVSIRGVTIKMILLRNHATGKNEKQVKITWQHNNQGE
jgi:hypothetical protein